MPKLRIPIPNFSTICTKLRPENLTNLSDLKLSVTHQQKASKPLYQSRKSSSSDSEKSVLKKGLNFAPNSKTTDESSVKQDVEKFFRRVHLKAFFYNKEDDSITSNEDTFETLQIQKSEWIEKC